ncbi:MAG: hypothetical protein H8E44_26830 [Planctomycetes bacterium]|nr:hypothetical protein [Planctomycetota bacterium]MBL7042807.1 hypothetical protein [Pirellulaceae bacterium]
MKWHAALAITVVCLAGCHAPTPSFDLLAPYGSPRVPPPSTGSHGTGGAYYNRTGLPATSAPGGAGRSTRPAASEKMQTNATSDAHYLATGDSWKPIRTTATPDAAPAFPRTADTTASRILPVSYNGAGQRQPSATTLKWQESNGDVGGQRPSLRLDGMPVTDATGSPTPSEPRRFQPAEGAIEIGQLPGATTAASLSNTGRTVVSSAKASDQMPPTSGDSSESKTTLVWR